MDKSKLSETDICEKFIRPALTAAGWDDGGSLSRYWLLSDQWPIDHGSCVVSMLKVVTIARTLGILVVGRLVPAPVLRKLEAGRIFAPQAQARIGKLWYPEDMASAVAEHMPTPGI